MMGKERTGAVDQEPCSQLSSWPDHAHLVNLAGVCQEVPRKAGPREQFDRLGYRETLAEGQGSRRKWKRRKGETEGRLMLMAEGRLEGVRGEERRTG